MHRAVLEIRTLWIYMFASTMFPLLNGCGVVCFRWNRVDFEIRTWPFRISACAINMNASKLSAPRSHIFHGLIYCEVLSTPCKHDVKCVSKTPPLRGERVVKKFSSKKILKIEIVTPIRSVSSSRRDRVAHSPSTY